MAALRRLPLPLLAASAIAATWLAACGREPPPPPRFTVMTYNLFVGMREPDAAVRAIRAGHADVVCLEEATPRWEAFLRRAFRAEYPHIGFRHLADGPGLGVLSRYPFEDLAFLSSPTGWPRRALRLHLAGREIQLLVVHLKPPFLDASRRLSFTALFRTPRLHRQEIEHACRRLERGVPTVVVGDFNEGSRGGASRWLRDRWGMRSALERFDRKTPTWHLDAGFARIGARLDAIFYTPDLACEAAAVVHEGASDHFPVVATLVVRDAATRSRGRG